MKESDLNLYLAEMALIKEFLEKGIIDEAYGTCHPKESSLYGNLA